jgi:hypothetical protein
MRRFKTSLLIGLSLLPALCLLFFSGLIAIETWPYMWGSTPHAPPPPVSPPSQQLDSFSETKQFFLAVATLLLTTVSTVSTLWLAWRSDKRQSREFELKIAQLQSELGKAKNVASN